MLIASQKPDAMHVAGFHTWRTLGRWVKKGEQGTAILAPMTEAGNGLVASTANVTPSPDSILVLRATSSFSEVGDAAATIIQTNAGAFLLPAALLMVANIRRDIVNVVDPEVFRHRSSKALLHDLT